MVEDNPYDAPAVVDPPGDAMPGTDPPSRGRRLRVFAVVVGVAVDHGTSMAAGIALAVVGVLTGQVSSTDPVADLQTVDWGLRVLPVGLLLSVLGGAVTGLLARGDEHLNALANVVLLFATGWALRGGEEGVDWPPWFEALADGGTVASVFLGAELARRRRVRRERRYA